LKWLAAVKLRKVNPQKLASQAGRALQRLKAHKYFEYAVDPKGHLQWIRCAEVIQAEQTRDGLYLLHQRWCRADSQRRSSEPLQEPPGGGGCVLSFEGLFAGAPDISSPTGSAS
jgi:hypothetical protein